MARNSHWLGVTVALAAAVTLIAVALGEDATVENPFLGKSHAIAEGRTIYRSRCYICHLSKGGKGPDLFKSTIGAERFVEVVATGRNTMPALGGLMTLDEIWKVHAYIKSTEHYE
jgi:mono/diheme cytochrome c family protein